MVDQHRGLWWAGLLVVGLALTACTGGSNGVAMSAAPRVPMSTAVNPSASPAPTASSGATTAVVAGPTAATDSSCPWLSTDEALAALGERIGRVTTEVSAGSAVGCTFYPAAGSLATSERLPPPDVPVIAIVITRYASGDAAHDALVRSAQIDPAAFQESVAGADEAVAYAAQFYAADGNADSACAFRKAKAVVTVQIAKVKASFEATRIAGDIAGRIA